MTNPTVTEKLIQFDNSYTLLPNRMFARVAPETVPAPQLLQFNKSLAEELGLDADLFSSSDGVAVLSGNRIAEGSDPIAMAYAGHQFGNWVPQLGDGRAVLLGEIIDRQGRRRDIQLKGSGQTPFSRSGDGKAPLGPVLREFLISEAMAALGVPTTRSLAAVSTGEQVYRETVAKGAILTRVAASHIRIGTLQYFYARNDIDALKALSNYAIARHYPEIATPHSEAGTPAVDLLEAVMAKQADLVAQWMGVGFIHGVMNTDNTTISGETIDFGPCAFMDTYHEGQVFSSIDRGGRYAYRNQPAIVHWNLAQLAQALLPLMPDGQEDNLRAMQTAIDRFPNMFRKAWTDVMRRKLGLWTLDDQDDQDRALATDLLVIMEANGADFTRTFRQLTDIASSDGKASDALQTAATPMLGKDPSAFDDWLKRWQARLTLDPMSSAERSKTMRGANPLFIPRNHLVERALAAAEEGDLGPFERLRNVLSHPFEDRPDALDYAAPHDAEQLGYRTFCGT